MWVAQSLTALLTWDQIVCLSAISATRSYLLASMIGPTPLKGPFDSTGFPVGCSSACSANLDGNPGLY